MTSLEHDRYTIELASLEDKRGFLDLHRKVFGTWPAESCGDVFDWKYLDNPFCDRIPVVVAKRDGEIVGGKGHIPIQLSVDGQQAIGVQTGDSMVHPSHRRRGLFTRMTRFGVEQLSDTADTTIFFGFPGPAPREGYRKMRFRTVDNSMYVRISSPKTSVPLRSTRLNNVTSVLASGLALAFSYGSSTPLPSSEYDIEKYDAPPTEHLSNLYTECPPRGIHTRRTSRFYEWRLAHPFSNYTTYLATKGGDVVAGIVVCEKYDTVRLAEMVPFETRSDALREIIGYVIDDCSDRSELRAWFPPSLKNLAYSTGFFPLERVPLVDYSSTIVVSGGDEEEKSQNVSGVRIDDREWAVQLLDRDW